MSFVAVAIGGSALLGIGGAIIGSSAANHAANTQANSADYAATLQKQAADNALAFQKEQFNYTKGIQAPFVQTGTNALNQLSYGLGLPGNYQTTSGTQAPGVPGTTTTAQSTTGANALNFGGKGSDPNGIPIMTNAAPTNIGTDANGQPIYTSGTTYTDANGTPTNGTSLPAPAGSPINPDSGAYGSLLKGFDEKFTAPTDVTEQNDPGYLFRQKEGQKALDAMAARNGTLFSGGTAKAAARYNSDYASREYGDVYSRAFNEYANRFNVYNTNQGNQYNRLANTAGLGQTAVNQLGYLGQQSAQNAGNITMNAASQIGQDAQNAGAARASGYVGSANAWQGGLSSVGNTLNYLALLNQLKPPGAMSDPSICWVAAELYGGWTKARTIVLRHFLFTSTNPRIVRFAKRYARDGEQWAAAIRVHPEKRARFRRLFDGFLDMATMEMAVA